MGPRVGLDSLRKRYFSSLLKIYLRSSMLPVGFEPTIPAIELQETHALDSAAIGIGLRNFYKIKQ